ncbi:MAG: caspase family protein [Bacteroidales bacterium]|nr:caspase family protein [Bacteroidales bacterium]
MKKFVFYILFIVAGNYVMAQNYINGKSQPVYLKIEPKYSRGMPPNIFLDYTFEDENGNNILESEESAILGLAITNKGKGPAQGIKIKIEDNINDPEFKFENTKELSYLQPGQTFDFVIPIKAGFKIKSAEHKLLITGTEYFGYDMDTAYLILNSLEYQKPKLDFAGLEIIDYGENTYGNPVDGKLQIGEQVKIKIIIQNTGQNIAENTIYTISTTDPNIYLIENIKDTLGDLNIGEDKEFWITISPNKRVVSSKNLPIYLTLQEEIGYGNLNYFQLPIYLNQKPSEPNIKEVIPDYSAFQNKGAKFIANSSKITTKVKDYIPIELVSPAVIKRNNAIAVVFGIEEYENQYIPAPYAENDAEIIKKYFEYRLGIPKENIYVYINKEATKYKFDDIFNADFGELKKAVDTLTDVFVFYSGHGLSGKNNQKIYLLPYDGKVELLEERGYNLDDLYKNLEKLNAKSVTVFIDACFSGATRASKIFKAENLVSMKGVVVAPKVYQPWEKNSNFNVFTSSAGNETSMGFDQSQTGLFTYYLCAGLQGKADTDGNHKITMGELKNYVIKNVQEASNQMWGYQTPEFHGNDNIILVEY